MKNPFEKASITYLLVIVLVIAGLMWAGTSFNKAKDHFSMHEHVEYTVWRQTDTNGDLWYYARDAEGNRARSSAMPLFAILSLEKGKAINHQSELVVMNQ